MGLSQLGHLGPSTLVRAGIETKAISNLLGISERELKDLYPYELGYTDAVDLATVADVAFNLAKSGEHPSMTKWWLTVKGGWLYMEGGPKKEPFQILLDADEIEDEDITDADFFDHE